MKHLFITIVFIIATSCGSEFLKVLPEDKITTPTFWVSKSDVELALSGCYNVLHHDFFYGVGPVLFATTPNGYWSLGGVYELIGNGSIDPSLGGLVGARWNSCFAMIYRTNYFLENYEKVGSLSEKEKAMYKGEAHFLRGVAYSLLAQTFGGVPIITKVISTNEARNLKRATLEDTWNRVISDFDIAIENLEIKTKDIGRATKGAALGMKMRAYLYQNKYSQVLKTIDELDKLGVYSLYPSYEGLFKQENENNQEVIFDVQNISDPQGLGGSSYTLLLPSFISTGGGIGAPTYNLVSQYEMADGGPIDPENPYEGRDPRLNFTVVLPGTKIGGYIFGVEAKSHVSQPIQDFVVRKYSDILVNGEPPNANGAGLNFIVLRYADVILAKAEALIETDQSINEAISLINLIRNGRDDVKITSLPMNLSRVEAREALRHERRIEFACEGIIYAEDIRRWEIGPEIYPMDILDGDGNVIETRYPHGYQLPKHKYLPIPENEISLNPNLQQNPGY